MKDLIALLLCSSLFSCQLAFGDQDKRDDTVETIAKAMTLDVVKELTIDEVEKEKEEESRIEYWNKKFKALYEEYFKYNKDLVKEEKEEEEEKEPDTEEVSLSHK